MKTITYSELLNAVREYIYKHGKTEQTLSQLRTILPDCWKAELIHNALELY